jgi:hypothetical protein
MQGYFAEKQPAGAVAFAIEVEPDLTAKNTANKLAEKMLR